MQTEQEQTDKADRHMNAKKWMLRHAAACFKTPMCSSKKGVLRHAAACCGCTCLLATVSLTANASFNGICNRQ